MTKTLFFGLDVLVFIDVIIYNMIYDYMVY